MKHSYLFLLSCLVFCFGKTNLMAQCVPAYLFPTITSTDVSCNGANDGCVVVNPVGARGNVGYQWSTGASTDTVCNLGQGFYTVTVTDTITAGPAGIDTAYFQDFEGTHGWNLSVSTGANGLIPNIWAVSDDEGGVAPPGCGVANNGDNTLHITCSNPLCGILLSGALYDATQTSNTRTESPVFSTVGLTNLILTFDYIANGEMLLDNASLLYNAGAGWVVLDPSLKSPLCVGGQGQWTAYSITLPAVCNNNPTVQIGINWTNDNNNAGSDPSIAINNLLVSAVRPGGAPVVCSAVVSDSVRQPFALVASLDTVGPVVCAGSANGLIDLSISGGTAPFTYAWSNGATTQDLSNLPDTTYTVIVTDANGCTAVDTATVLLVGALGITLDSIQNVGCHGDSTGAILISATGDTTGLSCSSPVVALNEIMYRPPTRNGQDPNTGEYIELIGPPGANIGCYILTDGDWTITIPPGTTIPADGYFTIGNDVVWGAGTFDLDAENCNCFTEGTGGQALLILTDGGEYVALFDPAGTFLQGVIYGSPSAGNTPNGTSRTTVGTTGCVSSVTIPNPPAFETAMGGVASNTSLIRDPDGSGNWVPQVGGSLNGCNAPGVVGAGSGVTYLWSNGDTTQDISGLRAGTYSVTITNRFGCTDTATYTVTQPTPLVVTATTVDTICIGLTTGSIDLTVSGGTTPYAYAWSNGAVTEDLTNLGVGIYCGTVTDANGCIFSLCDTIVGDSLDIPVDTLFICQGDSIQLPLNTTFNSVTWSPAAGLSNPNVLSPFARPTATTTYFVQNNTPGSNLVVNGDFSQGNVGFTSSYANYAGGIANGYIIDTDPRTYNAQHSGADHTTGTGNFLIADAATGNVDVWCQTIAVTPNTAYDFSMWVNNIVRPTSNFADPTLEVTINGVILVNSGPIPEVPDVWVNVSAQWNSLAATSAVICIRAAGAGFGGHDFGLDDISFRPTQGGGCAFQDSVVVVVQNVDLSGLTSVDPSCFGDSTGSINTNTTNLTYRWNTGDTTAALTNLPVGTYRVTVTGGTGCADSAVVTLIQPDSLYARLDSIIDVGCFNNDPGGVFITPIGGAAPYTYTWSNGAVTQDLSSVVAGEYCLVLSDGNGCVADTLCATVFGRDTISIVPDTVSICLGDSVVLTATATSGGNRTVQWTPSTGLSSLTTLSTVARPTTTTTYTVSLVAGPRACPSSDSVVVLVDDAAVSLLGITEPQCFGDLTGDITTATNSPGLQYQWSNNATTPNLTGIGAGTYTLVATGALGFCTDTLVVNINQPDSLELVLGTVTPVTCRSGNDGTIGGVTVVGGIPNYTYQWSNSATFPNLTNLTAGTYSLTVTDANNCTVVQTAVVTQPNDSISITYTATPVSCDATNDGMLTAIPIGGNPGYTYQWDASTGSQTGATAMNLPTGTYTVTVTDNIGCTATAVGLFVPANTGIDSSVLSLVILDSTVSCDLTPTGSAIVNQINNPVYTYLWSNGSTTQQVDNLPVGPFSVRVGNRGCAIEFFGTIQAPFRPTIDPYIENPNVTTSTQTPGTPVIISAGNDERPNVQYSWVGNPSTVNIDDPTLPVTDASGDEPGIYTLTLTATSTDAEACQDTGTVILEVESEFRGMPSAFTPNGDGVNELYRPLGLQASDIVQFRVFNRWGQEVYNGDELMNGGWDGTFQGVPQPTEVYIFLLQYQLGPNSRVEQRKGEFTLIR